MMASGELYGKGTDDLEGIAHTLRGEYLLASVKLLAVRAASTCTNSRLHAPAHPRLQQTPQHSELSPSKGSHPAKGIQPAVQRSRLALQQSVKRVVDDGVDDYEVVDVIASERMRCRCYSPTAR